VKDVSTNKNFADVWKKEKRGPRKLKKKKTKEGNKSISTMYGGTCSEGAKRSMTDGVKAGQLNELGLPTRIDAERGGSVGSENQKRDRFAPGEKPLAGIGYSSMESR